MPGDGELLFPSRAKKQLVIQAARGLFIKRTLGCLLLICFNIEAHLFLSGWGERRGLWGHFAQVPAWMGQSLASLLGIPVCRMGTGGVVRGFEEMLALSHRQGWRRWRRQLVGRRELPVPGAGAERDCRVLLVLPKIHSVGSARSPGGGSIPPGYPQSPPCPHAHPHTAVGCRTGVCPQASLWNQIHPGPVQSRCRNCCDLS